MSVSHSTRDGIDTSSEQHSRAMSTTRAARARLARRDDEHELRQERLHAPSGPAFVPFQLADEMYANIFRHPTLYGYPIIDAGVVRSPKFGYLFIERRTAGQRRPKLVDGLDWVPSSAANASTRILQDGVTELVRYYCARRTKSDVAKPHVKPYVVFQRSVYEDIKNANPRATTYDIKSAVGERWRSMTDSQKQPYKIEAQRTNRQLRRRMSGADPEQLLVRHEMWLQPAQPFSGTSAAPTYNSPAVAAAAAAVAGLQPPTLVLVHYLGDDAYQCLTVPPRPIIVNDIAMSAPEPIDTAVAPGQPLLCHPVSRIAPAFGADTMSSVQQTATTQLQLMCVPATPVVLPIAPSRVSAEFVDRLPHVHVPDELTSSSLSPESPSDDEPVAIPVMQASSRFAGSPNVRGDEQGTGEPLAEVATNVAEATTNVSSVNRSVPQEPPPAPDETWGSPAGDGACSVIAPRASPQMDDTEGVEGFFNGAFEWL